MDRTIAWVKGKRLSIRGRYGVYWVQYGDVESNRTRNKRHALRWACRIKGVLLEERNIRVHSLTFRGEDRFYVMAYSKEYVPCT